MEQQGCQSLQEGSHCELQLLHDGIEERICQCLTIVRGDLGHHVELPLSANAICHRRRIHHDQLVQVEFLDGRAECHLEDGGVHSRTVLVQVLRRMQGRIRLELELERQVQVQVQIHRMLPQLLLLLVVLSSWAYCLRGRGRVVLQLLVLSVHCEQGQICRGGEYQLSLRQVWLRFLPRVSSGWPASRPLP